jgi:hypothetical protein
LGGEVGWKLLTERIAIKPTPWGKVIRLLWNPKFH